MHPNKELIHQFYTAFAQRDYEKMNACYHEDARFSDSVFLTLEGKEIQAMWHMLCLNAQSLSIDFQDVSADDNKGSCHWEATYLFSATGREVHNIIEAKFEFKDGKIIKHKDSFNLWKWANMALGSKGLWFGWLPSVQNRIRKTAMGNLAKFITQHPEYAKK